jgi:hypothetical protein
MTAGAESVQVGWASYGGVCQSMVFRSLEFQRVTQTRLPNVMTYSIFCVGVPSPLKCDSMAGAINTACELINGGSSVSQIKGSDGFVMERHDIEIECLRRKENNRENRT